MAISTNGTVLARVAGALYNTQMSNATYSEVKTLDPATLADALYARDFSASTDAAVATTLVTNLGLASVTGLNNWVAAQLTAAGSHKGAKIVDLLNSFAQMTGDTTYGAYATAFNTKVDAALAASQTAGNAGGTFAAAGVVVVTGATFALTAGVDTATGTAEADTFNATGATLTAQDTITGGAGADKLVITDTTSASATGLAAATISGVEALDVTSNGGVGRFAVSAGTATGAEEVVTVTPGGVAGTPVAFTKVGVTINGRLYESGTLSSNNTTAAHLGAETKKLLTAALGNSVTISTPDSTSGIFTVTAAAKGQTVPDFTVAITNGTGGVDTVTASDTTPAVAIANSSAPSQEIVTFTLTAGTAASGDAYTVYYDGLAFGVYTGSTQTTALSQAAAQINTLYGKTIATVNGNVITVLGEAGKPLPLIGFDVVGDGSTDPSLARALVRAATTTETAATTAAQYDASGFADSVKVASQGDVNLKAASTATVDASTTAGAATISGGKSAKIVATKAVNVGGSALTDVDVTTGTTSAAVAIGASSGTTGVTPKLVTTKVTGGSDVLVTDKTSGTSAKTLTAVTVAGTADTTVTLEGDALTTLTVGKQTVATAITVSNAATADHDFVLNVADSGTSTATVTVTNNTAKSVALTAAGTNNYIKLDGDASLVKVTTSGAGKLSLDLDGSNNAITAFDGAASTGALTLSNIAAGTLSVKTGSGGDKLTTVNTLKASIDTGAGNDELTVNAQLPKGSVVNLGEGNDRLLKGGSGSIDANSSTSTEVTTIDGGAGNDVISAGFVTAGNGAQFTNFETLGLVNATFDATLLTASTITGLELLAGGGTYTGVTAAQSLTVASLSLSGTTTLTMTGVSGASDSYAITFSEANAAARTTAPTSANVAAGTVVTSGIENYTINSGGTLTWNSITLGGNTSANTVTITGASNLDLDFASGFGSTTTPKTGVTVIDGSAATGKLSITTTNVVGATAGFAVKGGSGNDTITTAGEVLTVTLGAGTDLLNVNANAPTVSSTATAAEIVSKLVTVTDFAVGDKIDFASGSITVSGVAKIDVTSATSLLAAANLAAAGGGTSNTEVAWFVYGGNTYLLYDATTGTGTDVDTGDVLVKLNGVYDLTLSTLGTDAVFTYVA
jgi:S-layer protein